MRVNLIMPDDLVSQIDSQAKSLGVSRSAYMVMSLSQKIQSEQALKSMPELQSMFNAFQVKLAALDSTEKKDG